jgi:DNA-binding PadR family transcriptional regulator
MARQYTPTLLGYVLLGMLNQLPRSGYDVRVEMESASVGHFSSSPGSIYPALQQLKKNGFIDSEVVHRSRLKPREVFHVTEKGKKTLRAWLRKRLAVSDLRDNLAELMLRFRFMEDTASNEETLRFLADFRRKAKTYGSILNAQTRVQAESSPHLALSLHREIAMVKMHIEWAGQAIETFEEIIAQES